METLRTLFSSSSHLQGDIISLGLNISMPSTSQELESHFWCWLSLYLEWIDRCGDRSCRVRCMKDQVSSIDQPPCSRLSTCLASKPHNSSHGGGGERSSVQPPATSPRHQGCPGRVAKLIKPILKTLHILQTASHLLAWTTTTKPSHYLRIHNS